MVYTLFQLAKYHKAKHIIHVNVSWPLFHMLWYCDFAYYSTCSGINTDFSSNNTFTSASIADCTRMLVYCRINLACKIFSACTSLELIFGTIKVISSHKLKYVFISCLLSCLAFFLWSEVNKYVKASIFACPDVFAVRGIGIEYKCKTRLNATLKC